MRAIATAVLGVVFAAAASAQAAGTKPKLVAYDWLPGSSMDDMARFVPDTGADRCQQRLVFDTPFGKKSRLQGSFLLSAIHFDAQEAQPGQLGSRQSEDLVATTSTGFIRGIELTLSTGQTSQKLVVESQAAPYQARYLLTQLGPVEFRMAFELGWAARTTLTLTRDGKPYLLRAWFDCDPELTRCRITNGQVMGVEDSAQGFRFDSPYFPLVLRDNCVKQ